MPTLNDLLQRLWQDYARLNPQAQVYTFAGLWIHTAETDPVAYDTLEFAIVAAGNTEVVETWSNLDSTAGYVLQTFDLADYSGTTVTLRFTGIEDHSLQTSFLIDDVTLTVS
jgi:aminopeptidase S